MTDNWITQDIEKHIAYINRVAIIVLWLSHPCDRWKSDLKVLRTKKRWSGSGGSMSRTFGEVIQNFVFEKKGSIMSDYNLFSK